jgi:hypothetical protein
MKIVRGYKTELALNDRQRTACAKHAGAADLALPDLHKSRRTV